MATDLRTLPTYLELAQGGPAQRDSLWDIAKSSAVGTWGNLRYGLPAALERAAGTLTPEDEQYYAAWNAAKQQQAQDIAPTGPATFDDWWSGKVGFGRTVAEQTVNMLPQLAGSIAGAVAGGAVGGPGGAAAGSVLASTPFFAGSNASRALRETGGITEEQATKSLFAAPGQAALDTASNLFLPGAGKIFGPLAAKAGGNIIFRAAKQGAAGAVTEALTETAQQAGERWAAGLDLTSPEANQEFLQAFATAAMVGGTLGGISGITSKKPAETTNNDITSMVDTALAGQPPQLAGMPQTQAPGQEQQTELPLYGGSAVAPDYQQLELPLSQVRAPVETQLELPGVRSIPLADEPVGTQLEMFDIPRVAGPTPPGGIPGGAMQPAVETQQDLPLGPQFNQFPVGYQGNLLEAPTYEDLQQALADVPTEVLQEVQKRARKRAAVPAPIAGAVEQELASRSAQLQGVAAPAPANQAAPKAPKAPKAPAPAAELTFENVFEGARSNQELAKLRGKSQEEVVAGVRKLLENLDARPSTLAFAERLQKLGLLDLNERGAAPEAAAPPTLLDQVLSMPQESRQAFVDMMPAKDRKTLAAETFRALGEAPKDLPNVLQTPEQVELKGQLEKLTWDEFRKAFKNRTAEGLPVGATAVFEQEMAERKAQSRSDNLSSLAERLGVVNNKGLTDTGEKLALKEPVSTEEVAQAAIAEGYEGKQASMFLRGAEGRTVNKFDTDLDQKAYLAGQRWKLGKPDPKVYSQGRKTALLTDDRKRVKSEVGRVEANNPEFDRRNWLIEAIDQREAEGMYGQVSPEDVEQLRRMVREGATDDQVNVAEEYVREGNTLFPEPDVDPETNPVYTPAVATRGAPTTRSVERAQLRARDEINQAYEDGKITVEERDAQINQLSVGNAAADELGLGRQARSKEVAAVKRANAKIETARTGGWIDNKTAAELKQTARWASPEQALEDLKDRAETYTRSRVREAYDTSERTAADRRRLMWRLVTLDEGNIEDVVASLKAETDGVLTNRMDVTRRGFLAGVSATIATAGLPPPAKAQPALTPAAPRTPTLAKPELQNILRQGNVVGALDWIRRNSKNKLYRRIAQALYGGKGWDLVTMAPAPDSDRVYGTTRLNDDGTTHIDLYGDRALSEEVFLHEAIHAFIQQRWAGISVYNEHNERIAKAQGDRADEIVRGFAKLWRDMGRVLKASYPELIEGEKAETWAYNFYESPDEAISWILTNENAQAFMRSIDETGARVDDINNSLWNRFVNWVRELFGWPRQSEITTALDILLDAGFSVLHAGAGVVTDDYSTKFAKALAVQAGREPMPMKAPRTVAETADAIKTMVPQLDKAVKQLPVKTMAAKTRKSLFGWMSVDHMAEVYGNLLPGLRDLTRIDAERHATQAKLAQLFSPIHQAFGQLKPDYQQRTENLMRATEFGVDPYKTWDEQTWLHSLPNADDIKAELVKWQNDLNTLRRNKADGTPRGSPGDVSAIQVYEDLKALNDMMLYSELSVSLENLVSADPELRQAIPGFSQDTMAQFREDLASNTDPAAAREFWKKQLGEQMAQIEKFISDFRGLKIQLDPKGQIMLQARLSPVELRLKTIKQSLARMEQAPYFHLGRHGDQYVSFVAANTKGISDRAALSKIIDAFREAGLEDIYISGQSIRPQMYIRFENQEARALAEGVLRKLQADGWLDKEAEIKGGPRSGAMFSGRAGKPEWIDEMVSTIAASPQFDTTGLSKEEAAKVRAHRDQTIASIREMWLDTLSDTALTKVMVARKGTPGYSRNMMRNYALRTEIHTLALANLSAAPKSMTAFGNIQDAVNKARRLNDPNHANVQTMADLQDELLQRQFQRREIEKTVFSDRLRAGTNAFFLGLSPGYLLTQVTQLGVLLWPELGKKHGHAKAFASIARQTGTAFKIMQAVAAEGLKRGADGFSDMAITPGALQRAGLTAEQEQFVHKMLALGVIDIGSAMRELGRTASGELDHKGDRVIRWATSLGLYTETLTRLTAALAAHELHKDGKAKGISVEDYARTVINEAMFNYAQSNTARKMGKFGILGAYTPIATQFMQYSAQLMQKLYREFHKMIGGDREAARFLAGHATAVTALAGTLGLPFATIAATATEMLVDMFGDDDEPYDATAAWRRWLSDIFGDTIGTTLARGVPRGIGWFDLSERVGEQDLLPFTELLSDRRGIKDALEANTFQSLGAPVSMLYNISSGLVDIANGDYVVGVQKVLPVALSNLIKGGSMAASGEFRNARGETLPIKPSAADILTQLFGLNPAEKAEYAEKNRDFNELKTSATARATKLRNKIVRSLLDGDREAAREAINQARQFDEDNPDFAVLPDIETSIRNRVSKRAIGEATGMPLGVNPKDIQTRQLLAY